MANKKFKINSRFRFILKHSLVLAVLILFELLVINNFLNLSVLNRRFGVLLYFVLVVPVALLYGIITGLGKLVFNRFNIRQASRFQARLIFSFSLIALIPIIPLTILTNNLMNQSLEIWLTKSVEESLNYGLNFVTAMLEEKKEHVRSVMQTLAREKAVRSSLLSGTAAGRDRIALRQMAAQHRIDSLFLLDGQNALIFEYQQKKLVQRIFTSGLLSSYREKKEFVRTAREGILEYVIGFHPVGNPSAPEEAPGGLIAVKLLPDNFSADANHIAEALQSYKQMELYKKPIVKGLTSLIVIIVTLTVFFIAIIVSYFLSRTITEPIKILLDGTKRIASGDLNFEISYHAKDEIKLLINSFNQMTKEILASKQALIHTQRLAAWRDIAQRMAHEIRNPLTPIRLSIERLMKKMDDGNFRELFTSSTRTILDEVRRLELLIKEFSEFANIPPLTMNMRNLNHVIMDTLNVFSGVEQVKFITELEKDLPLVTIDEKRIKEVVINLINNSMHALKETKDALIRITTSSRFNIFGRFVILEVEDNGKGIPEEEMESIFDPYFTTKQEGEGTGLGLSIVEKVVSEHHAKIRCESKIGRGTKFTIEFPC